MSSNALIFWFTGLSGSGKTTIAERAAKLLSDKQKKVKILDGDIIRKEINRHLGFSAEDIKENNRIIAELCVKNEGSYDYIFVPIISPFNESRNQVRRIIKGPLYLIYCKASIDAVIKRDPKGLYKKAIVGEISNFIGVDKKVPYQPPADADLVLDTAKEKIEVCVAKLMDFIDLKEKESVA